MDNENYSQDVIESSQSPKMSLIATLFGIFMEPGKTFTALRQKPKFLVAGLLITLMFLVFQFCFIQKIGFKNLVKTEISRNTMMESVPREQKDKMIEQQSSPMFEYLRYASLPIVFGIMFLIGGLIYWLAGNAMGGSMTLSRGVSTWVYSSFPPLICFMILNIIVLFIKSVGDIDPLLGQKGLIQANPAMLLDGKSMPVLATLLGSIDLFQIWGVVLAAIGLKFMGNIASGSAWSIVLILWLIGLSAKVLASFFLGIPV
jgi:Yip1 domain